MCIFGGTCIITVCWRLSMWQVIENELDFRIATDTPRFALTCDLWCVFWEVIRVNWPQYNGSAMYINTQAWQLFPLHNSMPDHLWYPYISGGILWPKAWVSAQIRPPIKQILTTTQHPHLTIQTHFTPCLYIRLYILLGIDAMLYSYLLLIHWERDIKFQWSDCEGNG